MSNGWPMPSVWKTSDPSCARTTEDSSARSPRTRIGTSTGAALRFILWSTE